MEVAILVTWILTILVPINGLLYLAAKKEREKARKLAMYAWSLRRRRG